MTTPSRGRPSLSVVSPPLSDDEPPAAPRGTVVLAVARPLLTAAALIVTYYVLPVDRRLQGWGLAMLVGELCLVVIVIVWQIRLILRRDRIVLPLWIVLLVAISVS